MICLKSYATTGSASIMDDLYISNIRSIVSKKFWQVGDAVKNGLYLQQEAEKSGYKSISVIENESVASLLDEITNNIFDENVTLGKDLSVIVFSSLYSAGMGAFWQPASYIQKTLDNRRALTFNLHQGCNSQLIALELISSYLRSNPNANHALSISGDLFGVNKFDRWNADYGIVYGDGFAGGLISKDHGDFKILHLESSCCGDLEELHRLTGASNEDSKSLKIQNSIKRTKKNYLEQYGSDSLANRSITEVEGLVKRCFNKTGCRMEDIRWVILPNLGTSIIEKSYLTALNITFSRTLWSLGSTIGHIGASDAFISLSHLIDTDKCSPGDKVMVVGAGAGFTWSCLLLEVSGNS